ncbi:MAG: hypothetical protein FWD45_05675 [Coriobacteriia bacterium]|nr:hypothetical protein [Coriobacteriia bacterium]
MGTKIISHEDTDKIMDLLMFRTIEKVDDNCLYLDNGVTLEIIPNRGGCDCGAGDYYLTALNHVKNAITYVNFVEDEVTDLKTSEYRQVYSIYVYAEHYQLLASCEGDDGSGYYGTGYDIHVTFPDEREVQ